METNQSGVGDTNANGSANGEQNQQSQADSNSGQKSVSWEDHQRAVKDMLRFKDQSKAESARVQELLSKLEDLNTKVSAQNKDFEALYASEKQKRADIEAEKNKLLGNVVNSERYRAAYPALKKAGLRDDADNLVEMMGLEAIEVEATSTGRFVCTEVERFVETAKAKFPYAFQKAQAPNVNAGGSGSFNAGEKWTPAKLVALESECKKKGDMSPFKAAFESWKNQGKPL
jgi:hypothetical protein